MLLHRLFYARERMRSLYKDQLDYRSAWDRRF